MSHSIDISERNGIRYLHFGSRWVQGAMRLARPWTLELAYTQEMMAGLLFRPENQWPQSALIVGLGAASQVRFIYRHLPACRMTAIEINPGVVAAAHQFFKLGEAAERLDLIIADAAEFVANDQAHYDLILVDAFDANGDCGSIGSQDFFAGCQQRLTPSGILSCNLLAQEKTFAGVVAALHAVFQPHSHVFPPCSSGNAVALASRAPIDWRNTSLQQRCEHLKNTTQLDFSSLLERLRISCDL